MCTALCAPNASDERNKHHLVVIDYKICIKEL